MFDLSLACTFLSHIVLNHQNESNTYEEQGRELASLILTNKVYQITLMLIKCIPRNNVQHRPPASEKRWHQFTIWSTNHQQQNLPQLSVKV